MPDKRKLDDKVANLESVVMRNTDIIKSIHETIIRLDSKLDNVDHAIRGNGAPGLREKIVTVEAHVEGLIKINTERHEGVVSMKNALYAACGGLFVGMTLFLLEHSHLVR